MENQPKKILLVEDEKSISDILRNAKVKIKGAERISPLLFMIK